MLTKLRICVLIGLKIVAFFCPKLVKFMLIILKRNVSPLTLQANVNAHAQIYFAAKSPVISPNGNPP